MEKAEGFKFNGKDFGFKSRNPIVNLVNSLIDYIPQEKRVDKIVEILTGKWMWEYVNMTNDTLLLDLLQRALGGDEEEYCKHLIVIYNSIVNATKEAGIGTSPTTLRFRGFLMERIVKRWFPDKHEAESLSKKCFETLCSFIVDVFFVPGGLKKILHEHLNKVKYSDLDDWILDGDTPKSLAQELFKIRARLSGDLGIEELRFLRE